MIQFNKFFIYRYCDLKKIPVHTHASLEVVYYERGTGITNIDGTAFSYTPNTFTVTPMGASMNEVHTSSTTPWCIHIDVGDFKLKTGIYQDTKDKRIFALFDRIRKEQSGTHEFRKEALDALCTLLAIEISRLADNDYEMKNKFSEVIREIETNCMNEIDIRQLAAITNYSYDRFRHLFKHFYGISPREYITRCRLQQAMRLLSSNSHYTSMYISQICQFPNYNQFRIQFKNYTGMTPKEYRQKHAFSVE